MSAWEIRIATVIAALLVGVAPTPAQADLAPELAITTLESLPVKGAGAEDGIYQGAIWANLGRC